MEKENVKHAYTLQYYTAIKKKEVLPFVATWMDRESIKPSEIRQKKKYYMISLIHKNTKNQNPWIKNRLMFARGGGLEVNEMVKGLKGTNSQL